MSPESVVILAVDDEAAILRFLKAYLEAAGYVFLEAVSGRQALELAASRDPDVILLDLGLPDMDGQQVLAALPPWSRARVIVLSARGQETDKVAALDAGASDYLTKPFSVVELAARIRALLRRADGQGSERATAFTFGDLRIDLDARTVSLASRDVRLTPIEFKLLEQLVLHAGKVLTHGHLLREVWGSRNPDQEHYVRIHVHKLRRKIERDPARPRHLHTETGVGYRFVE